MTHGILLGVVVALLIGLGVGLVNGLLTAFTKVPAFIVTLGTFSVCSGGALLATNGVGVYNFPTSFLNFGVDGFGVFPYLIIVAIVLGIAGQVLLGMTRFGRSVYAMGSNYRAARLSGLPVRRNLVLVYVISGVLSAVGGLLLTAYVASALPTAGANYNLDSIAAVVIGGGSLFGGQGAVWSAMLGALLMSVLSNGTELLGVSSYAQTVILGIVVVGAVFIDSFRKRVAV
jgi:ribose/xylose/arabinose/galactoside ABC-type transport system permease subunit